MKTSEMIAMLEKNPKLRFRRKGWDLSEHVYVSTSEIRMIKFFNSASDHVFYTHHDDWQLVREPVPVWEAIKALVSDRHHSWSRSVRGIYYSARTIRIIATTCSKRLKRLFVVYRGRVEGGGIGVEGIPKKCCYNCVNGAKYAVPKKVTTQNYKEIIEFNNTKRICVANYNMPSYPMYEKRSCKGFEGKEISLMGEG